MSSEARKQRQAERKKAGKANNNTNSQNQNKKSNKKNKPQTIDLVDTPFGNIKVKNTVMNRLIQELFKAANKGQFEKETYLACENGKSPLKAQWKGITATPMGKGSFSNQHKYNISWQEAFSFAKKIGFSKEAVQTNTPIENIDAFLPQILYITTLRAIQSMQESKVSTGSKENERTANKQTQKQESELKKDGTILIVEDRLEEKIGSFEEAIKAQGYDVLIAEDLKTAKSMLDELLKKNKLDGIILDFAIPVDKEDRSTTTKDIPNGVVLLRNFLFKINNCRIPVVINTTGDEEYKKKYLRTMTLEMPIYNLNHQLTPLASSNQSTYVRREILSMFNLRNQTRIDTGKIKQDKDWGGKGKSVYVGPDGKYHYRGEE